MRYQILIPLMKAGWFNCRKHLSNYQIDGRGKIVIDSHFLLFLVMLMIIIKLWREKMPSLIGFVKALLQVRTIVSTSPCPWGELFWLQRSKSFQNFKKPKEEATSSYPDLYYFYVVVRTLKPLYTSGIVEKLERIFLFPAHTQHSVSLPSVFECSLSGKIHTGLNIILWWLLFQLIPSIEAL